MGLLRVRRERAVKKPWNTPRMASESLHRLLRPMPEVIALLKRALREGRTSLRWREPPLESDLLAAAEGAIPSLEALVSMTEPPDADDVAALEALRAAVDAAAKP